MPTSCSRSRTPKRRKLAEQVARGELSLVKLREQIDGKPAREHVDVETLDLAADTDAVAVAAGAVAPLAPRSSEDDLQAAKERLAEALDDLSVALRGHDALRGATDSDRQNFAKYLTIAKLKLENAIAVVRSGEPR